MSAADAEAASLHETEKLYGIAQLAREFGITARAIRFYEAKGLLSPPRVNGDRVYTKRERARLKLLLRAKSIGFSLAEIKQVLDLYGDRGEGRPQQIAFIAERTSVLIETLEQKRRNIVATLQELKEINRQCLRYLQDNGAACNQAKKAGNARRTTKTKD
jgi:DNA-binding transcriptional MerR regulator